MNKVSLVLAIGLIVSGCTSTNPNDNPTIQYNDLPPQGRGTEYSELELRVSGCISHYNRDGCFRELGKEQGNLEFCDGLHDEDKWSCYVGVATEKNDKSICGDISPDSSKYVKCFTDIALQNNDPEICNADMGQIDTCYAKVAINTRNGEICDKINDMVVRESCLRTILRTTAVEEGNPELCEQLDQFTRDICFSSLASETKKLEYCEKISDTNEKDLCYIGVSDKHPQACDKIQNEITKQSCKEFFQSS